MSDTVGPPEAKRTHNLGTERLRRGPRPARRRGGTHRPHALPQRGGDARHLRPARRAGFLARHGDRRRGPGRRQRQHRRLPASWRRRPARGWSRRRPRLRQRPAWAASRPPAASTSSWATPTTATTSPRSRRSSSSCATGADLVMGNRFQGGIAPGAMPPLHRYLGNPVLSFIGRLFFRSPVGDFHCGLRGFRRDACCELGPAARRAWSSPARWWSRRPWPGMRISRGADHAAPGRAQPAAAPAHLARRLAAPALPAAVQPALAVPVPRARPDRAGTGRRRSLLPRAIARSTASHLTWIP